MHSDPKNTYTYRFIERLWTLLVTLKIVQCPFILLSFIWKFIVIVGPSGLLTNTDYYGFNTDILITF